MDGIGWLPAAAEAAGVDVYVMPGFETRSTWASGLSTILGVVWHHTATSVRWLDGHVAALLRDGRRDLSGPLSQIGVERDGTAVFVAAGRANHNGYGEWGNSSVGIEFYSDGVTERLTAAQIRTGIILTTLVLKHERLPASRTKGHKETDPERKIDPLDPPAMAAVRSQVDAALNPPPPPATHLPPSSENAMLIIRSRKPEHRLLLLSGVLFLAHEGRVVVSDQTPLVSVSEDLWNDVIRQFGPVVE